MIMLEMHGLPLLHLLTVAPQEIVMDALRRQLELALNESVDVMLHFEVRIQDLTWWHRSCCGFIIDPVGDDVCVTLSGDEVVVDDLVRRRWELIFFVPVFSLRNGIVVQLGCVLKARERNIGEATCADIPTLHFEFRITAIQGIALEVIIPFNPTHGMRLVRIMKAEFLTAVILVPMCLDSVRSSRSLHCPDVGLIANLVWKPITF